jgi:hypothetical protein
MVWQAGARRALACDFGHVQQVEVKRKSELDLRQPSISGGFNFG